MKNSVQQRSADDQALLKLQKLGDPFRTSDAQQAGIHTRVLYRLKEQGMLEQLSRGVYSRHSHKFANPDLVIVGTRIPQAIVCLISALSFHNLTTQVPHKVSIALPKGAKTPRLDYPPLDVYRFSGQALTEGVEEHRIDGITVKIYSAEKTLADCFKFRNKIGIDVALEALKIYKSRKPFHPDKLIKQAKYCRVDKIMRPYLEASL